MHSARSRWCVLGCVGLLGIACSADDGPTVDSGTADLQVDVPRADGRLTDGDGAVSPDGPALPGLAHDWSHRHGDDRLQGAFGVTVDSAGNVIVTGGLMGTVDFGGGALSAQGQDIFLAKFDAQGNHLWSQRFGDNAMQIGQSVAVDGAGNILLAANFYGTVVLDGSTHTSAGMDDILLAKIDPDGTVLWSRSFGSAGGQRPRVVAARGNDTIVLLGSMEGTADFGQGTLTSAGAADIFVASFDASGTCTWSKRFGDDEDQYGMGLAIDPVGNIVLSASFLGAVDLGQGPLSSAGQRDVLVAKLDPAGNALFAKRFGDADEQYAGGVAVDPQGNIVLASETESSMDLGGGLLTSAGKEDIFLARFDPDGAHLWSKRFGDAQAQGPRAIAVDGAGRVYLAASFQGTVDFGGGALTSAGMNDVLLVKLDASGAHLFSARYGDADEQLPRSIAVDTLGNVALSGELAGTLDLGGGALTSAGSKDLFVAHFVPAP